RRHRDTEKASLPSASRVQALNREPQPRTGHGDTEARRSMSTLSFEGASPQPPTTATDGPRRHRDTEKASLPSASRVQALNRQRPQPTGHGDTEARRKHLYPQLRGSKPSIASDTDGRATETR